MNLFRIILIALCTAAGGISVAQAGGDAQAGQQLIASCSACHGKDGNSASPANPKLAGQSEKYLLKQLKDIKSGARDIAIMTGQLDNLTVTDMSNIAAYFAGQTQTAGTAKPELAELGREIYRNGNHERGMCCIRQRDMHEKQANTRYDAHTVWDTSALSRIAVEQRVDDILKIAVNCRRQTNGLLYKAGDVGASMGVALREDQWGCRAGRL